MINSDASLSSDIFIDGCSESLQSTTDEDVVISEIVVLLCD